MIFTGMKGIQGMISILSLRVELSQIRGRNSFFAAN